MDTLRVSLKAGLLAEMLAVVVEYTQVGYTEEYMEVRIG